MNCKTHNANKHGDSDLNKRPNGGANWLTNVHIRLDKNHCTAGDTKLTAQQAKQNSLDSRLNRIHCTTGVA